MKGGSGKRSRDLTPSHSSGKSAISRSRTGAMIGRPVEQTRTYERTTKARYEDKQTGSYERHTTKEKASSGERHVERGSRQVGVRDEFNKSSTVKVGDKSGYTEYKVEERIRNVDFGGGSIANGPKNYASNNSGDSGDDGDDYDNYESSDECEGGYNNECGDDDADEFDGDYSSDCVDDDASPRDDCDGGSINDLGDDGAVPSDDCDGGCSDDCGDDDEAPSDDCDGGYSDDDY